MGGSTWRDVEELTARMPDAMLGQAHEGSPAYYAGRHTFARLRLDEQHREIVQLWSDDMGLADALAGRRTTFPVIHTFRFRVSAWAYLDQLGRHELAELLLDSYRIRGGRRRAERVDQDAYFDQPQPDDS
jgi:hypothetical protein